MSQPVQMSASYLIRQMTQPGAVTLTVRRNVPSPSGETRTYLTIAISGQQPIECFVNHEESSPDPVNPSIEQSVLLCKQMDPTKRGATSQSPAAAASAAVTNPFA